MNSIILIGSGGHCKSCIDVLETNNDIKLGIVEKDKVLKKNLWDIKLFHDSQLVMLWEDYGLVCVVKLKILMFV